ncbi:proteasome core particle subunit beta 3 [Fusarium falciforme]|nr:proteasome core particle subunit beta 3 [Fusarium falciforme]
MSDPSSINGGIVVAMTGKDCVAIACDLRSRKPVTRCLNKFEKIFHYGHVFLGITSLATDVTTLNEMFRYKTNLYKLKEERAIEPETFTQLVSSSLYERFGPYFVGPVVAGINSKSGKPFIAGFDLIGCIDEAKDFIVSGTASDPTVRYV